MVLYWYAPGVDDKYAVKQTLFFSEMSVKKH